jgi:hypothetical protein
LVWTQNRPLELTHHDRSRAEPGYTLLTSVRGYHATLIDMQGRIVHRWKLPEGIQYAYLLETGNLLLRTLPPAEAEGTERIGGSSAAIVELDWDGNVVWRHDDRFLHHDCLRLPGGNTLVPRWEKLPEGLTERVQGGHSHHEDPQRMWADVVQELAPSGQVVRQWRSWEHLDFETDVKCPLESRAEWTHLNGLALTPSGDWLMSFRLTDTIGLVDAATGAFKWKWGKGVLSHQHHPTWLPNGRVLVFDNGCHRLREPAYSRVVEVDPGTGEIAWQYKAPTVLAFNSFMVSGAERLAGGNTFITEGATGRLFEITPEGEVVWEYVSPFVQPSKFGPTPAIFRAHRYGLGDPRIDEKRLDPKRWAAVTASVAPGRPIEDKPQG